MQAKQDLIPWIVQTEMRNKLIKNGEIFLMQKDEQLRFILSRLMRCTCCGFVENI
jgi:hypothetical protein